MNWQVWLRKICCAVLVLSMLLPAVTPALASEGQSAVAFEQVENDRVTASLRPEPETVPLVAETDYSAEDEVRVSIMLEDASVIDRGYSTMSLAENDEAMACREELQNVQELVTMDIEDAIDETLDVQWNLTLAANIISATVKYGQIEEIEAVDGVEKVVIEPRYDVPEPIAQSGADAAPMMYSATDMLGMNEVWSSGYTGAGMRIAIIDTGLDTDHQSFSEEAYLYALQQNAAAQNMSEKEYIASLDLLDREEIESKLGRLNVIEKYSSLKAGEVYKTAKIPFAFNYIDATPGYVTHDRDSQTDHGSHVAGTAAANRFIETAEGFVDAETYCKVVGNAPDAQLIVMKVFGKMGGAYTSDFMAAIEDAIILGCDSVNLSLGSTAPGFADAGEYQGIMDSLMQSDTVVAIAGGNEYHPVWAASNSKFLGRGYLYAEDSALPGNLGSPGSYTNALTVASVNNKRNLLNGYFSILDQDKNNAYIPAYAETLYNQMKPLTSLDTSVGGTGVEYSYVFLDSNGYASDYEHLDVSGKIVICSRGEIAFFEKATNAVNAGAVATIVYNNDSGVINMDMTSYTGSAPAISITKEAGEKIKELSETAFDSENEAYWTGTLKVVRGQLTVSDGNNYYTMSDFSSWGTTGDLALKPEITAPGGNIYSVKGDVAATDRYKTNSGTSMATPQVSGVAAVASQFIQQTGFGASRTEYNLRHIMQSLLMSTATPLMDKNGNYYSLLQQGAGLVSGANVVGADSFIIMGQDASPSCADGKVKAELGDDPDKTGIYEFSFTLYNESMEEKTFDLSADVFTQAVFSGKSAADSDVYVWYSKPDTTRLQSAALFMEEGRYLSGNAVTVEGGGAAELSVRIVLSENAKDWMDGHYPNGGYVEAFVHVVPQATAEGVSSSAHSIPVLAFYGNWTDPSMFDTASYADGQVISAYNTANTTDHSRVSYAWQWETDYASYYGRNYVLVTNAAGETFALGGNPLVPDAAYMPERDAISGGVTIAQWEFATLRDSTFVQTRAENLTTGETYFQFSQSGKMQSTYYDKNNAAWQYFPKTFYVRETLPEASNGEQIRLSLQVLPEYYVTGDTPDESKTPGKGSELSITVSVDTTIPLVNGIDYNAEQDTLVVRASDNNHIAAVVLYSEDGREIVSYTGADMDAERGEMSDFVVKPSAQEENYLLQVFDYAMNVCTYYIKLENRQVVFSGAMLAYDLEENSWVRVDKHSDKLTPVTAETKVYTAATAVGDVIYAVAYGTELHKLDVSDASDSRVIGDTGVELVELAWNPGENQLYGVSADSELVRISTETAKSEVLGRTPVQTNTLACDENGVFFSNRYGSGEVYSYTLDALKEDDLRYDFNADGVLNEADCQAILDYVNGLESALSQLSEADLDRDDDVDTYDAWLLLDKIPNRANLLCEIPFSSKYMQAMEVDPNNGAVYWASYCTETISGIEIGFSVLYEIDARSGSYVRYQDMWHQLTGLLVLDKDVGSRFAPVDGVTDITEADRDKLYKYRTAETQTAIASLCGVDNTRKAQLLAVEPERVPVTIALTAETATTNGLFTVTYPENMELISVQGNGECSSVKYSDGAVSFAYVEKVAIPTGETLAVLTFETTGCGDPVTILQKEANNTHPNTERIDYSAAHNWGEWVTEAAACDRDGQRTRSCLSCGHEETEIISKTTVAHDWTDWISSEDATVNTAGQEYKLCLECGSAKYRWTTHENMAPAEISSDFGLFVIGRKRINSARFNGVRVNHVYRLETEDGRMSYLVELSEVTAPDAEFSGKLAAAAKNGSGFGTAIKRSKVGEVGWDSDELFYSVKLKDGIGKMMAYSYTGGTVCTPLEIYFYIGEGGTAYAEPSYVDMPGSISGIGLWSAAVTKTYWEEETDANGTQVKTGYIWLDPETPTDTEITVEFVSSVDVYEGSSTKGGNVTRTGMKTELCNGKAEIRFCSKGTRYVLHLRTYINVAPELLVQSGTDRVAAGREYEIDLSTVFCDRNGDMLCYTVSVNGGEPVAVDEQCAITAAEPGTMTLVFTAYDGVVESKPYVLTLEVSDKAFEIGDVNGDGTVNMKDASHLLRHLAGWDVEIDEEIGDVNGDGAVNMKDASHLLRYMAGWQVVLGKETTA